MKLKRCLLFAVLIATATLTACAPRRYGYYRGSPPPPYGGYRVAPRPHGVWVAGHWERHGHGWRYREGHWR